jgi:hypothetical protein
MARLALNVLIAEAAGIRVEQADRAIDAALQGLDCIIHTEISSLGTPPQPQISSLGTPPQPQISPLGTPPQPQISSLGTPPQPQVACRPPQRRDELVPHIAEAAGIPVRAAGIALGLVLAQLDSIGRDAGLCATYEFRP